MEPAAAERILRNISRVLRPCGHLFVSGVDLYGPDGGNP